MLNPRLCLCCDIEEQSTELGRFIDDNTLAWWGNSRTQDEAFGEEHERVTMDSLTKQLNKWCVGLDYIWCSKSTFDFVILQDLYKNLGLPFGTIGKSRIELCLNVAHDPRKKIPTGGT